MLQDGAIVGMADQPEVVYCLSNGAIFNNLERPQTPISKSGHSLTLSISEMAKDTAMVTIKNEEETVPMLSNDTIFDVLE